MNLSCCKTIPLGKLEKACQFPRIFARRYISLSNEIGLHATLLRKRLDFTSC